MKITKAILVDDEPAARNVLKNLLRRCTVEFEILAECEDLPTAVEAIRQHRPDIVFLDIQMPNYAGYEIVDFFEKIDFEIIFVTAYDQYAIKAFDMCAVDYLVKPIERQRLNDAVEKLHQKLHQKTALENYQLLLETVKGKEMGKIVISELMDGHILKKIICLDDIIAAEAQGAYSKLYLKNSSPLTLSRNLSHLESRLPMEKSFFRSHRSWIINLNCIKDYIPRLKEISLNNDLRVKLSKKRQELFEQRAASSS